MSTPNLRKDYGPQGCAKRSATLLLGGITLTALAGRLAAKLMRGHR